MMSFYVSLNGASVYDCAPSVVQISIDLINPFGITFQIVDRLRVPT